MKVYVGLKEKAKPVILESENEPNNQTHPQFHIIYGPFKTRADAERYVKAMGELACSDG